MGTTDLPFEHEKALVELRSRARRYEEQGKVGRSVFK